jgi:ABC-type glycerol-3-phosphate transport system substrate-binding protein
MLRTKATMAAAAASALVLSVSSANAQNQQLTLCWAAWDPANALAELSKDFTAESGIQMNFEFVPWTNFADRFLNELNSKGKLCDLMIGDSQWLGTAATAPMKATKGRASYLGERSIGHLDPGAQSSALLIGAVCDVLEREV